DLLPLGIFQHHPAADLLDGALAAEAEAALAVERADADARRHHAPEGRWTITHDGSGLLAEFRELGLQLVELALEVVDRRIVGGRRRLGLGRRLLAVGGSRRRAGPARQLER